MKVALKAFFAIIILLFGSLLMNITVQDVLTKKYSIKRFWFIYIFYWLKIFIYTN